MQIVLSIYTLLRVLFLENGKINRVRLELCSVLLMHKFWYTVISICSYRTTHGTVRWKTKKTFRHRAIPRKRHHNWLSGRMGIYLCSCYNLTKKFNKKIDTKPMTVDVPKQLSEKNNGRRDQNPEKQKSHQKPGRTYKMDKGISKFHR